MIHITQGQTNTIILTLTEKSTLSAPVYLFRLTCDQSQTDYFFIAADTSIFTDRYNQFYIREKSSPNPLNGEVSLPLTGYYHYTIYEQVSATNLNPANATGIVETGKCRVEGNTTSNTEYTPSTSNTVYNG